MTTRPFSQPEKESRCRFLNELLRELLAGYETPETRARYDAYVAEIVELGGSAPDRWFKHPAPPAKGKAKRNG